jgi:hypothetical protein
VPPRWRRPLVSQSATLLESNRPPSSLFRVAAIWYAAIKIGTEKIAPSLAKTESVNNAANESSEGSNPDKSQPRGHYFASFSPRVNSPHITMCYTRTLT